MKDTSGELILTIVAIIGIGAIGVALHQFAPNLTNQLTSYVTNFFNSNHA